MLNDIRANHKNAVAQGFAWVDDRRTSEGVPSVYGKNVFSRPGGFRMNATDRHGNVDPSQQETYAPGDCVSVPVVSVEGARGDIGGPSVARILAVLEDDAGCCHVCLHYYWKWGQIHVGAEAHPAVSPRHSAQLFLQAPLTADPLEEGGDWRDPLHGEDGSFTEVLPALLINHKVKVLSRADVEAGWEGGLDAYETAPPDPTDPESGSRDHRFWCSLYYDHTSYTFSSIQPPTQLLTKCQLTMADLFCGPGTVSLAARAAGWGVLWGVDMLPAACSSFTDNTTRRPGQPPFNPPDVLEQPRVVCKTVQALAEEVAAGRSGLPLVSYLHASPPCQNLSRRKADSMKTFDGEELRAFVKIVTHLRPAFVTLEEVPGFIWLNMPAASLQGQLAGFPNWPPPPAAASNGKPPSLKRGRGSKATAAAAAATAAAVSDDDEASDVLPAQPDDQQPVHCGDDSGDGSNGGGQAGGRRVSFNPCLLVVPQLLDVGYQVRLAMVNAAALGAPQGRWRVLLLAARQGFRLPEPPPPRYDSSQVQSRRPASVDPNFMPKDGCRPMPWNDVLMPPAPEPGSPSEAGDAAGAAGGGAAGGGGRRLAPHISVAEAIGDLPPIMQPPPAAAAVADSDADAAGPAAASECLAARLRGLLQASEQQLQQLRGADGGDGGEVAVAYLGQPCQPYDSSAGVLLCQLPAPLADLGVASRFSRYMRSPHYQEQVLSGFDFAMLRDHTCAKPHAGLNRDQDRRVDPRLLAGTILGKNDDRGKCVHFAEQRMLTTAERRRLMSIPDHMHIIGKPREVEQQVGNAVPYLLAVEMAASVMQAATGQPGQRPPDLGGPCEQGTGIKDLTALQRYERWLQAQRDWPSVVQQSRQALSERLQGFSADLPSDEAQAEEAAVQPEDAKGKRKRRGG